MEQLIRTANIYYEASSPAVKNEAQNFFKAIDHDSDGKVCLHEFLGFMREEGHVKMGNRHFFKTLDPTGNGTLNFMGVMALYYVIKSGRPFCCGCDDFIAGMYFTCSKCYQNSQTSFSVCLECFENGSYTHEHNHFLDNFALLELYRMQGIATRSEQQRQTQVQVQPTSSVTLTEVPATSQAVALYQPNPRRKMKFAYKALQLAVGAANLAANCAIM